MTGKRPRNYFIHSVAKAFTVLKVFDAQATSLTLGQLEEKTGINKATVLVSPSPSSIWVTYACIRGGSFS